MPKMTTLQTRTSTARRWVQSASSCWKEPTLSNNSSPGLHWKPQIDKVIFLVYTERRDDGKQNPGTSGTASANRVQEQRLSCAIRAEDMPLLADCANDSSFFQKKVTVQEMNGLMYGTLTTPLVALNLMGIAYFFDCLSAMNLVSRCWQTVLERSGSILLQGKNKPQTRSNFSSALNRARSNGIFSNKNDIDILMKHIREKYVR